MLKGAAIGDIHLAHLQYADDTLLLAESLQENAMMIKCILQIFELISGLGVNFSKSRLYGVNHSDMELSHFSDLLHCDTGSVPFTHLGLPIGINAGKKKQWDPLIKDIKAKIDKWDSRFLNFAGRLSLIKSSLQSLLVYYMSLFRIPKTVVLAVRRLLSNFLSRNTSSRNKPVQWVKWKILCLETKIGGLGIRDMDSMNIALLSKWRWRLKTEPDSLWAAIIKAKYLKNISCDTDFSLMSMPDGLSKLWSDIWYAAEPWFHVNMEFRVGNGLNTSFCDTNWTKEGCLSLLYKDLYKLSTCKNATVMQLLPDQALFSWKLTFRRPLRDWELDRLHALPASLSVLLPLSNLLDEWRWKDGGQFTVKSAYKLILADNIFPHEHDQRINWSWCKIVPRRIQLFIWRLLQRRIPTMDNIIKRGVKVQQHHDRCIWCAKDIETVEHLFFGCDHAAEIWETVSLWLSTRYEMQQNPLDNLTAYLKGIRGLRAKEISLAIWMALLWNIWCERNNVRYDTEGFQDVTERIKVEVWTCLEAYGKIPPVVTLSYWLCNPNVALNMNVVVS